MFSRLINPLCAGACVCLAVFCAGGASADDSPACHVAHRGAATPTLWVTSHRRVHGGVVVTTATRRLLILTGRRERASRLAGDAPGVAQAWLTFCLRAASVHSATSLVAVSPGGFDLTVTMRGTLELTRGRSGRRVSAGRVTHRGGPLPIQLRLDVAGHTVSVLVAGRRRAMMSAPLAPVLRIAIGARPVRTILRVSGAGAAGAPGQRPGAGGQGPAGPGRGAPTTPAGPAPGGTNPSSPTPGGTPAPTGPAPVTTAAWPGNPFSPLCFWNVPLATGAALDPDSASYVSDLQSMVAADKAWMNTTSYSTPVYVVASNQATQHVTLDRFAPDLQGEFDAVPLPADAQPAAGSDAQLTVWQPSSDKLWEFFELHRLADGWHAAWGGEMDSVSSSPGYFTHVGRTTNWGATATGLPLLGGLVTLADLQRGVIGHALAIGIPQAAKGVWSWPAQRSDGSSADGGGHIYIPEGTRFRLNPAVDVASLNLPPIDRMLALAAQQYGIVVRDQSGSVSFYGEDPTPTGANPWPAAFGHQYPDAVLAQFPWADLQALQPPG